MIALDLCERSGEMIEALEEQIRQLKEHSARIKQQVETSKQHGLGAALAAPHWLENFKPQLVCIESLAHRCLQNIEEATID